MKTKKPISPKFEDMGFNIMYVIHAGKGLFTRIIHQPHEFHTGIQRAISCLFNV